MNSTTKIVLVLSDRQKCIVLIGAGRKWRDGASRFYDATAELKAANQGYPDGYLAEYYDTKTGARKPGRGDTLAEFIVAELIDTFDPGATDDVQIGLATHVLERARTDLFDVIQALRERSSTSPVAK